MNRKLLILLIALAPLFVTAQKINIIPQPVSLNLQQGSFTIDKNTTITFNTAQTELATAAHYLAGQIKNISGATLRLNHAASKTIRLKLQQTAEIGEEGYLLHITPSNITITANSKKGIVYGMQTLFQLLPAIRTNATLEVPCMTVKDYPRFQWRGMHLDVSRHFFGPEFVKKYIDFLAAYKFNTFHWHLTDDQGWRIEIRKYPNLTKTGAWRVDENYLTWGTRPQAKEGEKATYGGYYTQEQVRDIVRYASERNITIVPEIEMPGHSAAAIASYPFLSCEQQRQLPMTGGNYKNISSNYCPGNDSVFTFLQNVLTEVIGLFPSKFIHLGGDEVDKTSWKNCPKCQKRMKEEGLKNEEELQSYFMKRMERFVSSKKRRMIGWDEILEGGLAPGATVMSWRGEQGGIAAAKMGHDVVMTPGTPLYFDHYQGDPATEPLAIGGFNSLKLVYSYDPIPAVLSEKEATHILGAQANLWAEFISSAAHVEYMVLPRMLALSEVVWSPKKDRNWNSFNEKLQKHFEVFDQKGLNYSKGNFRVEIKPVAKDGKLSVMLSTEIYNGEVFYTTDGKDPGIFSTKYTGPVSIDSSLTLKAITGLYGRKMSILPAVQAFAIHKAIGRDVRYTNPVSPYYMADGPNSLTDGIRGTDIVGKYWHGFSGKDLIATIDLGSNQDVHSISLGCLQSARDWIMMPQWVKFEVSADGNQFTEVRTIPNDVSPYEMASTIKDFKAEFPTQKARFIRVTAKAIDGLPKGHPGEGKPGWIFADEIMVY
ncbi:MAG: family 20 glycosylhydrolase [Chitinophagaceae bacterium]|nr:family 20 glycosylhydrolase [Chitinophagaceae bacterium]MCW5915221.1 family 20 glycosylhydrolase [Chitinophagaceae bacterium]MCZ2396442.1 family 20 glycosylhydrolase [Chitinophagales bacterium]